MTRSPSGIPSQSHLDHLTTVILPPHAEVHRRHPTKVTFCVRGVVSPLLANLYFRRFLLAWEVFGHRTRFDAYVVNYADDLVICCRPGNGAAALTTMRQLMTRLGLTAEAAKARVSRLPEGTFALPI